MRYPVVFLGVFLVLFTCPNTRAQPVPVEDAKRVAKNFFFERMPVSAANVYDAIQIAREFRQARNDTTVYYVFDLTPTGFVIVSAEKSARPIIGYSFSGSFRDVEQPCNFRSWMGHYEEQLMYMIRTQSDATNMARMEWDHLLTPDPDDLLHFRGQAVPALLVSTWNQDYPYNFMCPADQAGPHGHCLAGCVATAMGQLMYYYRWPVTGTGSYSYIHPDYGEISADFGSTTYRWEEMTNAPSIRNEAIAELLFHMGVSVDMDYGPFSSGMWNHKAAYSFKTYFNYSPETQYVYRDSTSMDWDSLVVAHLNRAMPCYYAGWEDYTYTSGHAFIVDGYQGDHFHMNWGWGGLLDGYFLLDNLTPGGNNFNYAQELIIHCHPDTLNYTYPSFCSGADTLHNLEGSLDDGSGPRQPYQPGASCSWLITPQSQEDSVTSITLTFDRFATAPGDTLYIHGGSSSGAPLLAGFSGNALPGDLTSDGNELYLTFDTDATTQNEGWFLTYTTSRPVWCTGITTLTDQQGQFTDGSGTFNYSNNAFCQWRIFPQEADNIELYFTYFDTEEPYDMVRVYNLQPFTLLGEFSGSVLPGNILCPSGKALVMFITNDDVTAGGWAIGYHSLFTGTGNDVVIDEIQVYPLPASDVVNIRLPFESTEPVHCSLTNLTGQLVRQYNVPCTISGIPISIDVMGLEKGCYLLRVETKNATICRKVMIY